MLIVSGDVSTYSVVCVFFFFSQNGRTKTTILFKSLQIYISLLGKCYFCHAYFYFAVTKLLEFKLDLFLSMPLAEPRIAKGPNSSTPLHKEYNDVWKSTFFYHFIIQVFKELVKFKGTSTTFTFKKYQGELVVMLLKTDKVGFLYPCNSYLSKFPRLPVLPHFHFIYSRHLSEVCNTSVYRLTVFLCVFLKEKSILDSIWNDWTEYFQIFMQNTKLKSLLFGNPCLSCPCSYRENCLFMPKSVKNW